MTNFQGGNVMTERFWVVTASADHEARGLSESIVQACHGKSAPLARMQGGDGVVIYSPRTRFPDGPPLQAFTAIGQVSARAAWQHDMGGGFVPWRREVRWDAAARLALIRPLLEKLDLTRGVRNWGMVFRYGLRPLTSADFARIAAAMAVQGSFATQQEFPYPL